MKKRIAIFMALAMVVLMMGACANNQPQTSEPKKETAGQEKQEKEMKKLKAVVTILPQVEWVRAVAGDLAEVTALLPPGASPEVYQASPKEMVALEEADFYFTISVPVEVEGIIPNTTTKAKIVNLAEAAAAVYPDRFFEEDEMHDHDHEAEDKHDHEDHKADADKHDHEDHKADADKHDHEDHKADADKHDHDDHKADADKHDHDDHKVDADKHDHDDHKDEADNHDEHHHHSGRDPHTWLSPKRVEVMVGAIRDAFVAADADNAEVYRKNADNYLANLQEKSRKLSKILSEVKNRDFIIMHPSMGYFAEEFDLDQISIEKEGKQATAEHLKKVIDYAKDHNIKVVFYQKEFDNNQAKTIAAEIGGEVMELEPLAPNYLENLDKLAQVFAATLDK